MSEVAREKFAVVVVGAGPAGIGAALELARRGVEPVLVLERWDQPGGLPAKYRTVAGGPRTYAVFAQGRILFGEQFADRLLTRLEKTSVEVRLECTVVGCDARGKELSVVSPQRGLHQIAADALIFATGAREMTASEQGWIAGSRTQWMLQTMQLLELASRGRPLSWNAPVVAGTNLIAYASAVKLLAAGARRVRMIDTPTRPRTPLPARWYFRRWGRLAWQRAAAIEVVDRGPGKQCLRLADGREIDCDRFIVSGDLVPNSELLVEAAVATVNPGYVPCADRRGALSVGGCFATGNVLGGLHGGSWCYQNGRRTGKHVSRYLRKPGSTEVLVEPVGKPEKI